jgi:hypothetical protein
MGQRLPLPIVDSHRSQFSPSTTRKISADVGFLASSILLKFSFLGLNLATTRGGEAAADLIG